MAFRAPRISCLFANTNKHTFFSSSSYRSDTHRKHTFKMAINSVFAIGIRSVSALSTTKTMASSGKLSRPLGTCVLVVTPPVGTNVRLSSQVPHLESQVVVFNLQWNLSR